MYLNYWAAGRSVHHLGCHQTHRADRNVNVEELVYYSRNYTGWLLTEYRVGGNLEMLRQFLAAENSCHD
jgi:hypothetical protein